MTRQQLVNLLYGEKSPKNLVDLTYELRQYLSQELVLGLNFRQSPAEDPTQDGEYLVHHMTYGWCLYGFTVKDRWGNDDTILNKKGEECCKVTLWTDLSFLED